MALPRFCSSESQSCRGGGANADAVHQQFLSALGAKGSIVAVDTWSLLMHPTFRQRWDRAHVSVFPIASQNPNGIVRPAGGAVEAIQEGLQFQSV